MAARLGAAALTVFVLVLALITGRPEQGAMHESGAKPAPRPAEANPPPAPPAPARSDDRPAPPADSNAVRAIRPDAFAPPFVDLSTRYERIAPRRPSSPSPAQQPPRAPAALLPRPVVIDAGTLAFGDRRLRLAGIKAPDGRATCTEKGGATWPCGALARTALRAYLRGRSLRCDVDNERWTGTVEARCTLAGRDIARWLVARGWATADPGSDLLAVEQSARADRRGLFGDDPRPGPR